MKKHWSSIVASGNIFSIDYVSNTSIVYGCSHGTISLVSDKKNGIVWKNKDSDGDSILTVDVSPNNDMVAGGGYKNCLFVINAANGDSICSVDVGAWIQRVLFISQKKIACALQNGTVAIVCWQTQKIEKILTIANGWSIRALAISPVNNDILLTGDDDGVIKQTIISSEKTVMVYEGHTHFVKDLSFFSCGNMFVSGSYDQTARLFAFNQKQAIRVFKGHTSSVRSVSLIHDDELLITTSIDDTVKVWKIESGECLSTVESEQDVHCGAVSKDKHSLMMAVGGQGGKLTILAYAARPAVSLDRNLKLSHHHDW